MFALFENYYQLMDFYRLNVFQSTMVTLLSDGLLVSTLVGESPVKMLWHPFSSFRVCHVGEQISRLAFIPIRHDSLFKTVKVGVCSEQGA